MIAVDTNILVYAHREDLPWHQEAFAQISELAEGNNPWSMPWPCIHEFMAIVTHPRIFKTPTPLAIALEQVEAWLESPNLFLLSESQVYWAFFRDMVTSGRIGGPMIHDARIAALCQDHGIEELWTADRDFSRFPGLKMRNPLIG